MRVFKRGEPSGVLWWGLLVTGFYLFVVVVLLAPGMAWLAGAPRQSWAEEWLIWIWIVVLVGGEGLLLLVSVDTSRKRLKPRQHWRTSAAATTLLVALLLFAGTLSLLAGVAGDRLFEAPFDWYLDSRFKLIAWVLGFWALWGVVFARMARFTAAPASRHIDWLLKGSILELLIAVPAHVVARHRNDCSAPVATSFGIATGIAIMLLCFGPGVLLLYRDRMARYRREPQE